MWKKNLQTPLSSLRLLRRTLTSTAPRFSIPRFHSRPYFQRPRPLFPLPAFHFPRKSFSSSQPNSAHHCWNCSAAASTTPFLLCSSCRCIQPVDHSIDYFQIFGLERKYDSVEEHLEGKYKDWQKKLHPDLVHSKSEKEREYAAEQSARVIDAYRTLSKPLARAIYIVRGPIEHPDDYLPDLKLEGVDIDEEETLTDLDLLSEIMEIREAVEEASDAQALNQIQSQMQEKLKEWSNSFAKTFESRNFEEAVKAIRRMTYYERVNEEIVKRQ